MEELKDHCGVDVLAGDGGDKDVALLDVEEGGAGHCADRGPDLLGFKNVALERARDCTAVRSKSERERER